MNTIGGSKVAVAGESQANRKYRAFAKRAEPDDLANIARLFRTTAEAERIHAEGHLKSLAGVGGAAGNRKEAIAGETHEYSSMYPPLLQTAEDEGRRAKTMFGYAVKAEAVHAALYRLALEAVERGEDLAEARFCLCPVCGHLEFGVPPERRPIRGALAARYIEVA